VPLRNGILGYGSLEHNTRLFRTTKKSPSLRVIVPGQVAELLKLQDRDSLKWLIRIDDSKQITIYVLKVDVAQ
jgi:hypothetical protein